MSLSLRTINAPGVEITEIDRSQYTQRLTGTKVLVAGFADKGEDCATINPTSRSSLINIYGKPTNEAERYFYEACKEVIQQGGTLYSAKIPYDNDMAGRYVAMKYTLDTNPDKTGELLSAIHVIDSTVSNFQKITNPLNSTPYLLSDDSFDQYSTGELSVGSNEIIIVDITRGIYGKTPFKTANDKMYKECIGIVPVITTAANALFSQMLLSNTTNASAFNILGSIKTLVDSTLLSGSSLSGGFTLSVDDLAIPFGGEGQLSDVQNALRDSITSRTNAYFPAMYTEPTGENLSNVVFNREHFKKIGIVVFKAYIDTASNNKINFDAVEAFVGSLDPNGKDYATGANNFIDNIVNTQSEYIRVFSNAKPKEEADILAITTGNSFYAGSLGFYEAMSQKNISLSSMMDSLNKIFDQNSDLNEKEIDVVVDAGMSTIGSYVGGGNKMIYDPASSSSFTKTLKTTKNYWRQILSMYDNFCKNTRKDCMFVADGMRQFCLHGKKKIVRPSKPSNTIDTQIIPKLIDMQVLNTNYGAGYCNWFEVVDEFSGDSFWCPPSIKAAGVYVYTDKVANYWDAPAGLNRGIIMANDVAFNPNVIQAGPIYLKNWNYAINYPNEGIALEGQKTMQIKPSAFDRVNVRRLFLRLERFVWKTARYFVYEPNTQATRNRFVDALNPYFSEVKTAGGMYDFKIICDESINTPEIIDNNELRLRVGIKPTKTIEFILIEFVALRTGGSWSELTNI